MLFLMMTPLLLYERYLCSRKNMTLCTCICITLSSLSYSYIAYQVTPAIFNFADHCSVQTKSLGDDTIDYADDPTATQQQIFENTIHHPELRIRRGALVLPQDRSNMSKFIVTKIDLYMPTKLY